MPKDEKKTTRLVRFIENVFEAGVHKYVAGKLYPANEATEQQAGWGRAEVVEVSTDVDRAKQLRDKAAAAADRAQQSAAQAQADLDAAQEAARIADEAEAAVDASVARELNEGAKPSEGPSYANTFPHDPAALADAQANVAPGGGDAATSEVSTDKA